MRIIGGKYRGKKLISPQSSAVRPTSDRTREALFNILRHYFHNDFSNCRLLELFCGSGSFSLEAVSQGFETITAVDIDVSSILKNIKLFPKEDKRIEVVKSDVCRLSMLKSKHNVLFMDPPYNQNMVYIALEQVAKYLDDNAICLIEMHKDEEYCLPNGYHFIEERRYGIAKIIIARFYSH